MHACNRLTLAGLLLCLASASAHAQGLTITIKNDTTSNIFVTVYDLNTNPVQKLLSNQLMNGFATVTVPLTSDSSGQGHLSWTAITVDPDMRQCGHNDKPNLSDGATVRVHADGDCGG
ncbi:MAG: hypothetical protein ACLPSY_00900 [Steroidobacteraceae bacterium]